jgi:hypothetical protein
MARFADCFEVNKNQVIKLAHRYPANVRSRRKVPEKYRYLILKDKRENILIHFQIFK